MTRRTPPTHRSRRRLTPVTLLLAAMTTPAAACELDGLSHGYRPMSALFAGAHRYQSLNGLEEEEPPPMPEAPSTPESAAASDAPSTPRRSFVAWARAKPKPDAPANAASAETPATWTRAAPAVNAVQHSGPSDVKRDSVED